MNILKKSVLISINPKWCELIASGKKTVEVRKTKPKIEPPFKVYIYQTKIQWVYSLLRKMGLHNLVNKLALGAGKVIGEFVCDCITGLKADNIIQTYYNNTKETCLSDEEITLYANGKKLYYWHISDLVIYDKPKELSDFLRCNYPWDCCVCDYWDSVCLTCNKPIRPPQSWCYVEGA